MLHWPAVITFEAAGKVFRAGGRNVTALSAVSLDIAPGQTLALLGASGSGKTTLLRLVNRLVEPSSGRVLVNGRPVRELDPVRLRRGIGYVIQRGGLFPHLSVAQNVGLLAELEGWSRSRAMARVAEVLDLVGLPAAEFGSRRPRELSGGQQQRVGVARALLLDPPIVLLDEPFGALDPITREQLQNEFLALKKRMAKTQILVTHDVDEAFRLADRVALLEAGRLLQVGTEADFRQRPASPFVAEFVRARHGAGGAA
ncbi:MAG: ATP-binding cassette domain-containing protein [Thermoanaerobaculia bacterium]|nr:ATP-binding cassette domain-containing protein [Thermoanaerobaculia bacterium]